jgi:poly(A) polymerase
VNVVEPRIISRKEHRISHRQISPNALRTLYRLHAHGFIAYLVGGCVRDLLLGRTPKDFDIGTDATPGQIKRLFRNCRLIGRRFRLAHLHFQDEIVEVSTFRGAAPASDEGEAEETGHGGRFVRHLKDEAGMVLADNVFGTPEQDALRRDFTINALAYDIADSSVIDYSTGLSDLKDRLICTIGDPRVRFTEDPVRMLRAVRFAASHDLVIERTAWEGLCELAPTIARVSPSRLYEEVQKLFLTGSARPAFTLLEKGGLLTALFPALGPWLDADGRRLALIEASLGRLDQAYREGVPASLALFLAAVFGPGVEEAALALHREGVPYQQAMDAVCAAFTKDLCKTVAIPGRVALRLRAVLALQASLRRLPPRRPASVAARPEFGEALAYLRLTAEAAPEHRAALEWWEGFLAGNPAMTSPAPPAGVPAGKERRRRRGRRGRGRRRTGGPAGQNAPREP